MGWQCCLILISIDNLKSMFFLSDAKFWRLNLPLSTNRTKRSWSWRGGSETFRQNLKTQERKWLHNEVWGLFSHRIVFKPLSQCMKNLVRIDSTKMAYFPLPPLFYLRMFLVKVLLHFSLLNSLIIFYCDKWDSCG